jgi:hypothetical protein
MARINIHQMIIQNLLKNHEIATSVGNEPALKKNHSNFPEQLTELRSKMEIYHTSIYILSAFCFILFMMVLVLLGFVFDDSYLLGGK